MAMLAERTHYPFDIGDFVDGKRSQDAAEYISYAANYCVEFAELAERMEGRLSAINAGVKILCSQQPGTEATRGNYPELAEIIDDAFAELGRHKKLVENLRGLLAEPQVQIRNPVIVKLLSELDEESS